MDNNKLTSISPSALNFLSKFIASFPGQENLKSDNDKKINSAVIYEKIRVAVEYQEEHLVLKNAIARIIRRKYTLTPNISAERLFSDLISELAWANYLNPEKITEETAKNIREIIKRYLVILYSAKSGHLTGREINKMVIEWLACELEETLKPDNSRAVMVDYAYSILSQNLELGHERLAPEENEVQLKAAIYGFLFKPDYGQMQYWFLRNIYSNWKNATDEELGKVAQSFDPFFNKIDHAFNHPHRKNYIQFTKRLIPPFIILSSVLNKRKIDLETIKEKPNTLHHLMMEEYNQKVAEARKKVWRGTIRALIFILITKISMAFIVEIPYDRYTQGAVDMLSLIINISLPPLLMFFAGTFVKSPPAKNYKVISESANNLLVSNFIDNKKYPLVKGQAPTFYLFNLLYTIFSLAIFFAVLMLLLYLKFNIVSIILFFFFVSVVSFFSFRIRNIALELAMKRSRDDALTSALELIMMPFIRIGKFFSDRFATFNPFILVLDFLIEAPLKTLIRIFNSWRRFFNSKKEELEL